MLKRSVAGWLRRNAVALVALFVALGGTSYAIVRLPPDSVGRRQVRDNAVGAAELASGSVAAQHLSERLRGDLRRLSARGVVVRTGQITPSAAGEGAVVANGTALCNAGEQAVSGGYTYYAPGVYVETSAPYPAYEGTPTGWSVSLSGSASGTVIALCTPK